MPRGSNKKIALLISVLALFLAFSETLGKSAQTSAITYNVAANDLWAFYQAKNIRQTMLSVAGEQMQIEADRATDPAVKARLDKTIADWKKTIARYNERPGRQGRPQGTGREGASRPSTSAISRWRAIITTRWRRPRSRSASCWPRRK